MIKFEQTDVYGFEAAIRGMRNPKNSWDKSDSFMGCRDTKCDDCPEWDWRYCRGENADLVIGPNDRFLMQTLSKAGTDHRKFLRMITVTVDITAPLYWWKEFDTYKVGTVANSCSTMHKIADKEFTLDDFSCERLDNEECVWTDSDIGMYNALDVFGITIDTLNYCRNKYVKTKDKKYFYQMIQLLPSSYNQKRTIQMNYEVLANIYFARRSHKLDEWRGLCSWAETLPYFKEICISE